MTSNVQLENGYTRIANELLEIIYGTNFNATQIKILLVVIRYTYGFNRKSHSISLTFLSNATGISKRYVSNELNKLISNNVILVKENYTVIKSRELRLNKNYSQWKGYRTILQQVNDTSTDEEPINTTDEQLFNTTDEQYFHQERKTKENIKEIYISLVDYLNLKANKNYKSTTKKTQSLIDARLREGFTLDDFKKVIDIKTVQWLNDPEMNKYLRPETLFGTKFESYLNEIILEVETELPAYGNSRGSDKRL